MYPFREGAFAVTNGWYVAGFSEQIGRTPVQRMIVGLPMALYRKEDGTPVAVGGRCPHRHFPLGKSSLRSDDIVCGYHGIAFGPDGQCTAIPSQDSVPRSYRIPTYPTVEHGMWVFVWPGDPTKADPALLPDLVEIGYEGHGMVGMPITMREVACRYQLLNDNLLDLTHLAFLHGNSIGSQENARVPEELSREPGVLRSRRYIRDEETSPAMKSRLGFDGLVDNVVGMDFYLPGFHAGIGDVFVAASSEVDAGKPVSLGRVYHAITPATQHTCYYFFGIASADAQSLEEEQAWLNPVIDEDIFASEEIEKLLAALDHSPPEFMLKSDRGAVEGRRALQAMMDAEAGQAVASAA